MQGRFSPGGDGSNREGKKGQEPGEFFQARADDGLCSGSLSSGLPGNAFTSVGDVRGGVAEAVTPVKVLCNGPSQSGSRKHVTWSAELECVFPCGDEGLGFSPSIYHVGSPLEDGCPACRRDAVGVCALCERDVVQVCRQVEGVSDSSAGSAQVCPSAVDDPQFGEVGPMEEWVFHLPLRALDDPLSGVEPCLRDCVGEASMLDSTVVDDDMRQLALKQVLARELAFMEKGRSSCDGVVRGFRAVTYRIRNET